ncbi:MAG: hypothetical protein ABEJ31_13050 [Haloarculaceae archaeon]
MGTRTGGSPSPVATLLLAGALAAAVTIYLVVTTWHGRLPALPTRPVLAVSLVVGAVSAVAMLSLGDVSARPTPLEAFAFLVSFVALGVFFGEWFYPGGVPVAIAVGALSFIWVGVVVQVVRLASRS